MRRIEHAFTSKMYNTTLLAIPRAGFIMRGQYESYWFPADAALTTYRDFVVVRAYARTFVYKAVDARIRSNHDGVVLDGSAIAAEAVASPVATSLASGHFKQLSDQTICPDCFRIVPPVSTQSQRRHAKIFVNQPLCNSDDTIGSCDSCVDFFASVPCCDVASGECPPPDTGPGSGYGYYNGTGQWVSDPCYQYVYSVDLYAACQALGGGAFLPPLPSLRSSGVNEFSWYTNLTTRTRVDNPFNGSVFLPYNITFNLFVNDLIFGSSSITNEPVSPLMMAGYQWCLINNQRQSPFLSEQLTIFANGAIQKTFNAQLALPAGASAPVTCP
jgi:hypothetical protein